MSSTIFRFTDLLSLFRTIMRWPSRCHFIFGYNAEMKINSKEIETALKFMPVVKINKEFNENVRRLDLREYRICLAVQVCGGILISLLAESRFLPF